MSQIRHDAASRRFAIEVDGHLGYLEYERDGGTMAITHTIVPPAIGGRGIAAALVQAALVHARAMGWRVRPSCSYVRSWMRRHPETQDLLE